MKKTLKSTVLNPYYLMLIIGLPVTFLFLLNSCNQAIQESKESLGEEPSYIANPPEWSKNANIYEVNIRQYTPEGTFKAFEAHLPRLNNMGVKILWLMPIFPVGEKNRKGTLGSYYAVKDYKAVNPEFGTMEDFKALVTIAHEMGFKVILDWVANHTAWDNHWIIDHPEWYSKDSTGKMIAPFDWTDVADLNYDDKALWDEMIDALKFWVTETDIDGYRCDVASMVPVEFWEKARYELDQIKPVFMLAEAEEVKHHDNSFDMSYAWELHHIFNEIAKGKEDASSLPEYFEKTDTVFPHKAYRMTFITNHDENSWNGTVRERMGAASNAFAVLTYTLPGMPLIYSGQEVGLDKRLEFFEKDQIVWDYDSPLIKFYTNLTNLKTTNPNLWNGLYGADIKVLATSAEDKVFAFIRGEGSGQVLTVVNLTGKKVFMNIEGEDYLGKYEDYFSNKEITFTGKIGLELPAWGYNIFIRN
ncbi:MAG: alpha amylase C-terminal domain-containing protein [Bacteroidales bacterium]|nr:alpha amylase C-terminal domain-containing protein [Bacteroidales bacterium]MCF8403858.1 alpha amylase C-terminal domain-containing protein [Bacteroidales bacterium]